MPADLTTVTVQGVTIRLHRLGHGAPVLFLHGAGGLAQWLPFYDALGDGFELLVPEHPGFGASDDPPWIRDVPDLAMFYLDFIEALRLDRFHLIGHSLGGWVAAEMLVRDRARCRSLTLIAPAGVRIKGLPSGDLFIWNPEETQRNLYYDQSFADAVLAQRPSEEQIDVMLKNRFTATKFGWQPRWFDPHLEKWLHRIKLPTLVIWGEDDKIFPVAYAERWRELLPEARVVTLARCGHVPQLEQAQAVIAETRAFLKEAQR